MVLFHDIKYSQLCQSSHLILTSDSNHWASTTSS